MLESVLFMLRSSPFENMETYSRNDSKRVDATIVHLMPLGVIGTHREIMEKAESSIFFTGFMFLIDIYYGVDLLEYNDRE